MAINLVDNELKGNIESFIQRLGIVRKIIKTDAYTAQVELDKIWHKIDAFIDTKIDN